MGSKTLLQSSYQVEICQVMLEAAGDRLTIGREHDGAEEFRAVFWDF
jgi:hypothetical protein